MGYYRKKKNRNIRNDINRIKTGTKTQKNITQEPRAAEIVFNANNKFWIFSICRFKTDFLYKNAQLSSSFFECAKGVSLIWALKSRQQKVQRNCMLHITTKEVFFFCLYRQVPWSTEARGNQREEIHSCAEEEGVPDEGLPVWWED